MTEEYLPTEEAVAAFDMIQPMIGAAHKEMSELSKKKQDGILNDLKVRHINRLLTTAQSALAGSPSLAFLELLDEATLPQNSDAVLILGQWLAAMDQFKVQHQVWENGERRWFTLEDAQAIEEWEKEDDDAD
jgi:hypothetical protein